MTFPKSKRIIYKNNPLIQVVCQLRFPTILSISSQEPFKFQEAIRNVFPNYKEILEHKQEINIEKQDNKTFIPKHIKSSVNKNHKFSSMDEQWFVNLTSSFISITTKDYERWEEFWSNFQAPLNSFIDIYKPAYFSRTGLRYIDAFSRNDLELESNRWNHLIKPFVLGFLSTDDIPEEKVLMNKLESEISLDDGKSSVKINALLGHIDNNPEKKFIIDSDFFSHEKVGKDIVLIKAKLDYLHDNSTRFIRWVIKDKLHESMEPSDL